MDPNRFDAIARTLGTERSRRGILKTLGAATLGALGVAGLTRAADAAPGGNSACAQFCTSVFPPGPQRGQCVSDAAHGMGLCSACNANPANYCNGGCTTNYATDPNNCGGCGNVCTTSVANATATCNTGKCGHTCNADYHDDGNGGCAPDAYCYWQDIDNNFAWDLTGEYAGSESACRALDSCACGGGNNSVGGCYRWATSPADADVIQPVNGSWDGATC